MLVRLLRYHFEEERPENQTRSTAPKAVVFLLLLTSPPSGSTIRSNHLSKEDALVSEVGLCIIHHCFVAARFLLARKFSSSIAARLPARCAFPFCGVMESKCILSKRSPQRDFFGSPISMTW